MAESDWLRGPEGRRRGAVGLPRRAAGVRDSRGRGSSSGSSLEDLHAAAARPARKAAKGQARINGAEPPKPNAPDARGAARQPKTRGSGRPAAPDSSPDERQASGAEQPPRPRPDPAKKRSRASRTRRYLRRISSAERFQPIEPAAASARRPERPVGLGASDNPLVQQTLRYFSEFEREAAPAAPPPPPPPPPPPHRNHASRLLVDGASLDGYRRTTRQPPPPARGDPPDGAGGGRPGRGSGSLEEALCELEAIYNSLQLGDEELLDRAERRTMEEFLYKGFAAAPGACGDERAARRNTWADSSVAAAHKEERHEADRLKDDMAYRRMHPKERPTSADGQSCLSSISYLMTSPEACRRRPGESGGQTRRGREPDVTLDDVVFRSMHHANNTLKVVEPQPPFGIPLGPISAAPDSDYLHSQPCAGWERARSPCREPDLVTDDLAFRSLRKDALPPGSGASRQASPSPLPSPPSPLAARGWRPAQLYGPPAPRRISDPEPASPRWHARRSDSDLGGRGGESADGAVRPGSRTTDDDGDGDDGGHGGSASPPAPPDPPLEASAYRQLCQDLENLVQLARGIGEDAAPAPRPPRAEPIDGQPSGLEAPERLRPRPPVAREASARRGEAERRDRLHEDAQPAKLGGDWRESAPSGAPAGRRRASLVGEGHWEGEIRPRGGVSMVCRASRDASRLTAKHICDITNHVTAQCCLLLVLLLALLLAIRAVP